VQRAPPTAGHDFPLGRACLVECSIRGEIDERIHSRIERRYPIEQVANELDWGNFAGCNQPGKFGCGEKFEVGQGQCSLRAVCRHSKAECPANHLWMGTVRLIDAASIAASTYRISLL
jgi:hypothetical protein